ncbi:hypothetical protein DPU24_27980 [Salmonella enterica subsp. enterica serovar Oranienburg]|nr:hypothetical protein [Salmonella enterica subsp. enterica serovar Poona]EBW6364530.1 hypothetical protein [Salmonella enterica subsp. enterica serovar Oranienburg]EGI6330314.1 hypothetical protein [Salmonella enterica subsp. enterica serovar Adelaide]EHI3196766.1 hypothetical protein [Salmonella enterica]HAK8205142.1 hypothetical protein [Salmonella enterica]
MNYISFLTHGRSRDADRKSGHLAWCCQVALVLTGQDGGVLSAAQENLFLTRNSIYETRLKPTVSIDPDDHPS